MDFDQLAGLFFGVIFIIVLYSIILYALRISRGVKEKLRILFKKILFKKILLKKILLKRPMIVLKKQVVQI